MARNPGRWAGSGVRPRGGEALEGEETELRTGRLGEAEGGRRRRDAGVAGRGREEYKERGAGVRAKEEGDSGSETKGGRPILGLVRDGKEERSWGGGEGRRKK